MDVSAWLRDLGLERYAPAFAANDVDAAVLATLTAEDLTQLGVASVGHRRKLLEAIAVLRVTSAPTVKSTAPEVPRGEKGAPGDTLPTRAERRQITVLFCDLVGSTELSTRLDPEDLGTLLADYRRCGADTIARWEGHVAKYMGDGVLAYFGWPHAHEDDAERAVRAGLDLVAAVGHLETGRDTRLAVRIGIATGGVVVGDLIGERDSQEHNVVGATPNLAARLQSVAHPGAVVIDSRTRRLLGDLFEFSDLGPIVLKGFADPVRACEVLRPSNVESRFEALHAQQTPLVGREEEIGILLRRWEQARDGEGQVVLLSGEPGIGKSRTSATLFERLASETHVRLRYFCTPHHVSSPLHPFIAQLARAAGFEPDEAPVAKLAKLEAVLVPATPTPIEDTALLAELLSIPPGEHYQPLMLEPAEKKERTLAALLNQLKALAATNPVLMLFEDAHWIDPTSREVLERTVACVEHLPILLVLTFRPEFQPPWLGQAHVSMHALRKLNRRESVAMIDRLTGGKALPPEVAGQIIAHTDGVPLFLEELTKAVLEGTLLSEEADRYVLKGPLPPLAIPTTLQASLLERLDRLAPVRDIAQIGAAIGREFPYELLAAVAGRGEPELGVAIEQLVDAGLLFRRGTPPRSTLMFKHALVQDAAYASLLRSRRQELHARIAGVLEEAFPEIVETQPEVLAHHCTRAGLTERAIDCWQRAGERALERSANLEAVRHFGQGVELIESLPVSSGDNRREFRLYLGLGPATRVIKGNAAPETLHAFARARELIDGDTSVTEQITVLYGLWGVHFVRAEHEAGRKIAEQALILVADNSAAEAQALASRMMGETLFAMGEFVSAEAFLRRAMECCSRQTTTDLRFSFDHEVGALGFLAWVLCCLGHFEGANAAAREAFALSSRRAHAATSAMALHGMLLVAEFRRDSGDLRARSEATAQFCEKHGITLFGIWGRISQGVAKALEGNAVAGIQVIQRGMGEAEQAHAILFRPKNLGFLAEAHANVGEHDHALRLLDEALALVTKTDERHFEAELHRLRGEVLLARGDAKAEACFEQALAVAHKQNAKLWELRAAVSLGRLWRDRGKAKLVRDLLTPIHGWFPEDVDSSDLQAAKALLESVTRTVRV